MALREPRKQRKRKWVKYERRHSMILWHTDWFRLDEAFGSLELKANGFSLSKTMPQGL